MQCFEKKKSPGPDDIKPIIFEHLPTNVLNHLVFIYRSMILLRYTPLLWKGTRVIFIPKPGKPNYNTKGLPTDFPLELFSEDIRAASVLEN